MKLIEKYKVGNFIKSYRDDGKWSIIIYQNRLMRLAKTLHTGHLKNIGIDAYTKKSECEFEKDKFADYFTVSL